MAAEHEVVDHEAVNRKKVDEMEVDNQVCCPVGCGDIQIVRLNSV